MAEKNTITVDESEYKNTIINKTIEGWSVVSKGDRVTILEKKFLIFKSTFDSISINFYYFYMC